MKILETLGAQGEIRMFRIDTIPADAKPLAKENGQFIIGHSETGHHHVLEAERVKVFEAEKAPEGMRILYALRLLRIVGILQRFNVKGLLIFSPDLIL